MRSDMPFIITIIMGVNNNTSKYNNDILFYQIRTFPNTVMVVLFNVFHNVLRS